MLDFYIASDSKEKPKPDMLNTLEYAGGLEFEMFERLVRKEIIDSRFDFYSDFRWGSKMIKQIDMKIREYNDDSDVVYLKKILDKAQNLKAGLIAYGD
ncbi:hypothetical protein GCM10011344_05080 [Dokdonia pacifica]|uniref:Uncharacterized protein n=1 Tax=Dokdonia pacifica TaxID=1627892 RepID=A0A238ZMM3_9FLAO|nr:hypothetical protein [Dokdonia pacifica]GGG07525.1 hypothetical protein GCM10011344_05080 [Dokdonia pacifica]SNR84696.1 hypothetical protein SAMN06265376_103371 [Dokdonia pacifica]